MAELPIPNEVKKLWDIWQLRGCIILSLFLQALLVSFASMRRRSKNSFLVFFIWSAYLLADWAAAIAIGLITQSQTDLCESNNGELFAFWASFLLLHLGGPDGITSFALEDNEFWLRHLFGLVLQVLGALYSIYLTLPNNKLWLPTFLVFVVGVVKYMERTLALYLASSDHFGAASLPKPNPGWVIEVAPASTAAAETAKPPAAAVPDSSIIQVSNDHQEIGEFDDEIKLMQVAYKFHDNFKGLIVGFGLSSKCQESSRKAFMKANHISAFKVVEIELSIFYEVLYTKAIVIRNRMGYIFRFIGFSFVVVALIFFTLFADKDGFEEIDIGLTYALLIGAIAIDLISIVHDQLISSDWTLGALCERWATYIPSSILKRKRSRWSGTVLQYNMISYCLDQHRIYTWLNNFLNTWNVLDTLQIFLFSNSENVTDDMKASIFNEMVKMVESSSSNQAERYQGLRRYSRNRVIETEFMARIEYVNSLIGEKAYLPELLTYHLAIEIYSTCTKVLKGSVLLIISRYLFYLMVTQPTMLSPNLGNWEETYQETVNDIKKFLEKNNNHLEACEKIKGSFSAIIGSSDDRCFEEMGENKGLFLKACVLARKLLLGDDEEKDELEGKLLGLLVKGSMNCEAVIHGQRLSKGGELLSFVWLLSNHFGLQVLDSKEN
ncbi:hypothetical protein G4B88_020773 [Cannabis sativa]|uniref:DUF4220 domain-containing protein n=2 Tax=Cannabis sativa TaxID=3483 RepID=A0A7J6HLK2_CANSA|nr:hypothetical protein G4B88_020773 [Cannabis sativa]